MRFLKNILATLGLLIVSSCATAHMLITYTTDVMVFREGEERERLNDEKGDWVRSFFLEREEIKIDVTFVTPDFDLSAPLNQNLKFYDSITSAQMSGLLNSFIVDPGGYISFETEVEEALQYFSFSFGITEVNAAPGEIPKRGMLSSTGYINWLNASPLNYNEFTFYQYDWEYRRHDQVWTFDTKTTFASETPNRMSFEKIAVSEPHGVVLLLTGLIGAGLARRLRRVRDGDQRSRFQTP